MVSDAAAAARRRRQGIKRRDVTKNAILNAKWVSVSGSHQLGIALQRQNERWYKYEVGHGGARDEFATRFESSSAWVRKGARHGGAAARMADDRAELSERGEGAGSRDKEGGGGFEVDGFVEFAQGRGPRSRVRRRWSKRRWGWEVVIGRSGRGRAHDPAFSG